MTTENDVQAIWLEIQILTDSDPTGAYQSASNPWNWAFYGGQYGPFIVSLALPKGTVVPAYNDATGNGASGTITITHYTAGQDIGGTFDAQFGDGTHLTESFDVPFCTTACYSN